MKKTLVLLALIAITQIACQRKVVLSTISDNNGPNPLPDPAPLCEPGNSSENCLVESPLQMLSAAFTTSISDIIQGGQTYEVQYRIESESDNFKEARFFLEVPGQADIEVGKTESSTKATLSIPIFDGFEFVVRLRADLYIKDEDRIAGQIFQNFTLDAKSPLLEIETNVPTTASSSKELLLDGKCEAKSTINIDVSGAPINALSPLRCDANGKFSALIVAKDNEEENVSRTIHLKATDSAGNETTLAPITWIRDSKLPQLLVSGIPTGTTNLRSFSVSVTCQSGLNVAITGVSPDPSQACPLAGGFTFTIQNLPDNVEEQKTITVSESDGVNPEVKIESSFMLDTKAPEALSFTNFYNTKDQTQVSSRNNLNQVAIKGNCEAGTNVLVVNGSSSAEVACQTGNYIFVSPLFSDNSQDGNKDFVISQTDKAGNTKTLNPVTWTRDTTPPTLSLNGPSSISAEDENGADKFKFNCEDSSLIFIDGIQSGTCAASAFEFTPSAAGNKTKNYSVTAKDDLGNESAAILLSYAVDSDKPRLAGAVVLGEKIKEIPGGQMNVVMEKEITIPIVKIHRTFVSTDDQCDTLTAGNTIIPFRIETGKTNAVTNITFAPKDGEQIICIAVENEIGKVSNFVPIKIQFKAGLPPEIESIKLCKKDTDCEVTGIQSGDELTLEINTFDPVGGFNTEKVEDIIASIQYSKNAETVLLPPTAIKNYSSSIPVQTTEGESIKITLTIDTSDIPISNSDVFFIKAMAWDKGRGVSSQSYSNFLNSNGTIASVQTVIGAPINLIGLGEGPLSSGLSTSIYTKKPFAVDPVTGDIYLSSGSMLFKYDSATGKIGLFSAGGRPMDEGYFPNKRPFDPRKLFNSRSIAFQSGTRFLYFGSGVDTRIIQVDLEKNEMLDYLALSQFSTELDGFSPFTYHDFSITDDGTLYFLSRCKNQGGLENQDPVVLHRLEQDPTTNMPKGSPKIIAGYCGSNNGQTPRLENETNPLLQNIQYWGDGAEGHSITAVDVNDRYRVIYLSSAHGNTNTLYSTARVIEDKLESDSSKKYKWYFTDISAIGTHNSLSLRLMKNGKKLLFNGNDKTLYEIKLNQNPGPNESPIFEVALPTNGVAPVDGVYLSDKNKGALNMNESCTDSGVRWDQACLELFGNAVSGLNDSFYFASNIGGHYRIHYLKNEESPDSRVITLIGKKVFNGLRRPASMMDTTVAGVVYKKTSTQGFPKGTYFMTPSVSGLAVVPDEDWSPPGANYIVKAGTTEFLWVDPSFVPLAFNGVYRDTEQTPRAGWHGHMNGLTLNSDGNLVFWATLQEDPSNPNNRATHSSFYELKYTLGKYEFENLFGENNGRQFPWDATIESQSSSHNIQLSCCGTWNNLVLGPQNRQQDGIFILGSYSGNSGYRSPSLNYVGFMDSLTAIPTHLMGNDAIIVPTPGEVTKIEEFSPPSNAFPADGISGNAVRSTGMSFYNGYSRYTGMAFDSAPVDLDVSRLYFSETYLDENKGEHYLIRAIEDPLARHLTDRNSANMSEHRLINICTADTVVVNLSVRKRAGKPDELIYLGYDGLLRKHIINPTAINEACGSTIVGKSTIRQGATAAANSNRMYWKDENTLLISYSSFVYEYKFFGD